MNPVQTEMRIIKILQNKSKLKMNNECILLNGPWGIGKTHMIERLSNKETFEKRIITISIFGKESIRDIEDSIIFKLISRSNKFIRNEKIIEYAGKLTGDVVNKVSKINISDYINIVSVEDIFSLIGNKNEYLICIDDFERKSDDINMKNLMGLIERLKMSFDVLIVTNSSKMDEESLKTFNTYKEKVINNDISLDTWGRETLVQILKDMELDQKDKVIDVYLKSRINSTYRDNKDKQELDKKLFNIRIFKKYIELVLNTLEELNVKKVNTETLTLCKKVVYNYFFTNSNKKKVGINYTEQIKLNSLNKVLHYEKLTNEEKAILLNYISEVKKNIETLFQSHLLNEEELSSLILKIKQKISTQEKEYFINEKNVILIFSGLEENGLLNEALKHDLLNVAISMYSPKLGEKHRFIMPSIMNDFDFKGEVIEASKEVKSFINELNNACDEKFKRYIENEVNKSKHTGDYLKLLELTDNYEIKSINEFTEIFNFLFENLVDNYSKETEKNIIKLIYATNGNIIRDFFIKRKKGEKLITITKKYEFFDEVLNEKMYMEHHNYYEDEPVE